MLSRREWLRIAAGAGAALTLGGLVPILCALGYGVGSKQMRRYHLPQ
jgi:hypothetical protein